MKAHPLRLFALPLLTHLGAAIPVLTNSDMSPFTYVIPLSKMTEISSMV